MTARITITPSTVEEVYDWTCERDEQIVALINRVREDLGTVFGVDVASVDRGAYRDEVASVFANGDLAVNVATLIVLLRQLHVAEDYPGFIVDEVLGRELAGQIAGNQPLKMLAEATFHYADATHHPTDAEAGIDDLDAALAAGFQTRLPGWQWTDHDSPFGVRSETT